MTLHDVREFRLALLKVIRDQSAASVRDIEAICDLVHDFPGSPARELQ